MLAFFYIRKVLKRTSRKILLLLMFQAFAMISLAEALTIEAKVDSALQLIRTDKAASEKLSLEILDEADKQSNFYGLVKANYVLGYLHNVKGDYGKAVIYYLEGVRYAELSDYENSNNDLANLLQNSGLIFKKFGSYELAREYYQKAMNVVSIKNDVEQYTHLIYLTSMTLKEEGKYEEAASLLESTFPNFHLISKKTIANIYNYLGVIYNHANDPENAQLNFGKLLQFVEGEETLHSKYATRAYHNLGNTYFDHGNYNEAIENLKIALQLKYKFNHKDQSLFITAKDLGESFIKAGQVDSALVYLNVAEGYYGKSKSINNYYELYKLKGLVLKAQGDITGYTQYQDLYASSLEGYLAEQREIEAADKKYNLDLITQRYFALVAEQERNKQIQYYSSVGGSVLVSIIILIIVYYQIRRYRLRKDLEVSLRPYVKNAL